MIAAERLAESTTKVDDLLVEAFAERGEPRRKLLAQAMYVSCETLRQITADPFIGHYAELTSPPEAWGEQVRELMQDGEAWQEFLRTERRLLREAGLRERAVDGLLREVEANYRQFRERLITPAELEQSFQRLEGMLCGRADDLSQQAEFSATARGMVLVLGGATVAVVNIAAVEAITPFGAGVSCTVGAGLIREGTQSLLNQFLPEK